MTPQGLLPFLASQKDSILRAIPNGLKLAGPLGLSNLDDINNKISAALSGITGNTKKVMSGATTFADDTIRRTRQTSKGSKWWLFLLLAGLVGLVIWLTNKSGTASSTAKTNENDFVPPDTVNSTATSPVTKGTLDDLGNFIYDPGKIINTQLPGNGGQLEIGELSTEAKLFSFLNNAGTTIDTVNGNWFELTNVRFKTGSSAVTDESLLQLKNIVAISKAYPSAQFRIGGYTDNTGDSTMNVILSQK